MSAINDRLARALDEDDNVLAQRADDDFHGLLLRQSHNQRLYAIINDLKARLRRIEVVYFGGSSAGSRSVEEHQAVIAALACGDTEGATQAIEQNWLPARAAARAACPA